MRISVNPEYFTLIPYTPKECVFSIDLKELGGKTIGESNGYYSETVDCYLYPTGD